MTATDVRAPGAIEIERWPRELPLRALRIFGLVAVGGGISAAMKLPACMKDLQQHVEQQQQLNAPSTP